jgi:hypothetical protein
MAGDDNKEKEDVYPDPTEHTTEEILEKLKKHKKLKDWNWNHTFMQKMSPRNAAKIFGKKFGLYFPLLTFIMMTRFIMVCGSINSYSDGERFWTCKDGDVNAASCPKVPADRCGGGRPLDATEVYDVPLKLLGIHHIIEYMRILLLWIISLVGVPLMMGHYITIPNTIFGLVAIIYAISAVASAGECANAQQYRHTWLIIEIILFFVTFVFYSFPQIFFLCLNKNELEVILVDEDIKEKVIENLTDDKSSEIAA